MKITDILTLTRREALTNHVEELDKIYFELEGRHFCRSCPADITTMFNKLKQTFMNDTKFRLIRERATYRVRKGVMISNDKMTDELALEWLKDCPERIKFFYSYPENWKDMLNNTEAHTVAPTVAPTEIEVVALEDVEESIMEEEFRANLEQLKLSELKEIYPEISVEFGQKKSDFIDKIIETNK